MSRSTNILKQRSAEGSSPMGRSFLYRERCPRHLEVSRSTIELAYEQLLSEGYLESEPCRGYFVAQIEELYQLSAAKPALWKKNKKNKKNIGLF